MASSYFYSPQQYWRDDVNSNNNMTAFNETRNIPNTAYEIIDDKTFVKRWLSNVASSKNRSKNTTPCPSITEMKQFLSETFELCDKIERLESNMRNNIDNLSCVTWNEQFLEISRLKTILMEKEVVLKNDGVFDLLKKRLAKRLSKRERLKRRKVKLRKETVQKKKLRDGENNRINQWVNKMRDELQIKKQEENVKFETDMILRGVIKRKTEAKRHLSLLTALRKLRTAKHKSAIGRGERVDAADTIIFNKNIDKLATMWSQALDKYLSEERDLKEKLNKDFGRDVTKIITEITPIKESGSDEIIKQWRENLYGSEDAMPQRNFYGNIEAFVCNRGQWDQYLWMNEGGSRMPSGWVTPPETPTDKWKRYLRPNTA